MKAINLRVDYLKNPLGLGNRLPTLSWNDEGGIKQTAYRLLAKSEGKVIFDSGKVESSAMRVVLPIELSSHQTVEWAVMVYDENGKEEGFCEPAKFEMGLLSPSDFLAHWISGDYPVRTKERYPVDCFKKTFRVSGVSKARLYITACGLYEARINGARVGEFVLAPGHTDYKKRIQLQAYDVTSLLKEGENVIEVELADGWYRGSCGAWGLRNQYGKVTKLYAQLEVDGAQGKQTIVSDASWSWSNDGPIRFADNKDGERVDANRKPSYAGRAKISYCKVIPTPSNNVYIQEGERFAPIKTHITPSGKTVYEFPQNIAGYVSFRVKAKGGERIKLVCGELCDEQGEVTLRNIQCRSKRKATPLQEVEYICRPGDNAYKTKFAIFGFQYVSVEGKVESLEAIAVYSALEETLCFDSSNPLLNRFVDSTRWSAKNNSADVPTDCPTRERHGWTGDSELFFLTAAYLFNYAPFAKKHLTDVYDWQKKDGKLPQIAPSGGVDFYMAVMNGAPGWADAGIMIPYRYSHIYQDKSILREFYPGMRKYAEFIIKRMGRHTVLSKPLHLKHSLRKYAVNYGQAYGEWAEPADVHPTVWTDMILPKPEVATAYASWMMGMMKEIASKLDKQEDAERYAFYQAKTKEAYQAIRKTEEYKLDTDRQALLVRPLFLDLLDPEQTKYAKKRLVEALDHYSWRLGTGFLSTPLILYVLETINPEYAYKLLENEEMPGWLFMPKSGATTIWESWEGTYAQGGIASLDHYSKGACLEWVFSRMMGINPDGENHFTLSPLPGGHFAYASCEYRSVFGKVAVKWKKEEGKWAFKVEVPANCSATFVYPDKTSKELTAGTHELEYRQPYKTDKE